MDEKKYTDEGYLIVSESDKCSLWEKCTQPCNCGWTRDCFFCCFADFRRPEYILRLEDEPQTGKLYSVCHNEKNKKVKGEGI